MEELFDFYYERSFEFKGYWKNILIYHKKAENMEKTLEGAVLKWLNKEGKLLNI
jgi:hypothetical protein